jgi:two-component system chemotaxis response regulator CheB
MKDLRELRILVVDDSAVNRRSISQMLADIPNQRVVGKAANGEEALRLVRVTDPDVITLDLEMPKMDGFTFLRILMAKKPLPVLVISSYSQQENVFKALELGALDFVTKPDLLMPGDHSIRDELLAKLAMVRGIHQLKSPNPSFAITAPPSLRPPSREKVPSKVVVIGASTGGPSALMEVISRMPETTELAILIAQHMPEKFTRTFAERLDRRSKIAVREAEHDEPIRAGEVLLCPGMRCLEIVGSGDRLHTRVVHPALKDRYYPSADRLFASAAKACPKKTIGVILTGMADDGTAGALELKKAGGHIIAESEATAVVYGMPRAAVEAGAVHRQLPLDAIAGALLEMERSSLSTRPPRE